jgi:hypothetical protein
LAGEGSVCVIHFEVDNEGFHVTEKGFDGVEMLRVRMKEI